MGYNGQNIVDKFGRVHDYLRISLTERCNLRCFYCMPEEGIPLRDKAEFMSSEELISIAREFVGLGIKKIRLTGGEPLLKKGAGDIIRELGRMPVELGITTNGILIDQYIDIFREVGIKSINVSLDSLKEDRFNMISRRNYFDRIISNIQLLLDNQIKTKINVVLMKGVNGDEIIDFIEWSRKVDIQIRFIEFMPFDGNNWNSEKKVSEKEILEIVNEYYGDDNVIRIADQANDTTRNFRISGGMGSFGIISSVTNPFCSTCNRIRLTADGKIKNCLFSQTETDLLKEFRDGKEIRNLIIESIDKKYKSHGGLESFDEKNVNLLKNRSMVRIGG